MNAEEKYLFDLMGFLVVKQVLSRDEVDELNALIDSYDLWRKAESGQEAAWVNDPNFMTLGALHTWDEPFRRLLAHPKMMPYLKSLVGPKFRYDHGHALLMRPGSQAARPSRRQHAVGPGPGVPLPRWRDHERAHGHVLRAQRCGRRRRRLRGRARQPQSQLRGPEAVHLVREDRAMGLARARGGRRRDHLQRSLHARDVAVARSSRAAEPALQVRARAHRRGRRRTRRRRTRPRSTTPSNCGGFSTSRTWRPARTRSAPSTEKT